MDYSCPYGPQCPQCPSNLHSHPQYYQPDPTPIYTHHIPQYTMSEPSRPSSSGYDAKPQSHQHMLPQEPPQIYRPVQYTHMSEASRQPYETHWQMNQPIASTHPEQPQWPGFMYSTTQSYLPGQQHVYQAPQYGYMPIAHQHSTITTGIWPPPSTDAQAWLPAMPPPAAALDTSALSRYPADLHHGLPDYVYQQHPQSDMQYGTLGTSPPETYLSNHSASSSDCGWQFFEDSSPRSSFESLTEATQGQSRLAMAGPAVSNPGMTLHIRSDSDNSQDESPLSASSFDSFGDLPFPSESPSFVHVDLPPVDGSASPVPSAHSCSGHSSSTETRSSPSDSSAAASPPTRPKRHSQGKPNKTLLKKPVYGPVAIPKVESDGIEKRGRRKGPLRPDQRKQAGEIRKLRACLRCKFLKKTCDTNEICAGCKPSHARLWQVPCTRVDIKEFGFFLKDWALDHERHPSLAIPTGTVLDIKHGGQTPPALRLWISHGYGVCLPIDAHEKIMRDNTFGIVSWAEQTENGIEDFNVFTSNLGSEGVDADLLTAYVETHIGSKFPRFVRNHFQDTPFLSEMLLTAFSFYQKTGSRVVKNALKLLVAYNLTMSLTWVESEGNWHEGMVKHPTSSYQGKVIAPTLINQAIKKELATMWRELQKDVLSDLSGLFAKVYTGDKLKNWPTIFIVASLLLAVWEEIQFDTHRRQPDSEVVEKFCDEMESMPVGVITGLFQAISQKVPAFSEWDTESHHHLLGSNEAACDLMTEVRGHYEKHEEYLRERENCKYDSNDFDSLSNKFLSKLVIKS